MLAEEMHRKDLIGKIRGYQISALIHLVVRWDLADRVCEGQGLLAIAEALSVDVSSLRRMIRALAAFGIFSIDHADFITPTAASRLLMRDNPQSLHAAASFWGLPSVWQTWGDLDYSIRTACLRAAVPADALRIF